MRKPAFISIVLAALVQLYSCTTKEQPETPGGDTQMSIDGILSESVTSKTSLDAGLSVVWTDGDAISLFDGNFRNRKFIASVDSRDSHRAVFNGNLTKTASKYLAAYPYSSYNSLQNDLVYVALPQTQTALAGTFANECAIAVAQGSDRLEFKNVCAFVSFTLGEGQVSSVQLRATGVEGSALVGSAAVKLSSGEPALVVTSPQHTVTLSGLLRKGAEYYFTVYPGSYRDATLVFRNSSGKTATVPVPQSSFSLNRLQKVNLGTFDVDYEPGPSSIVSGTVKYDDGTPAVGVSVSDGFKTALTDEQGNYSLDICSDTWYIYISLPSDAAVRKNNDGRPDFFKKYEPTRSRYDFSLERITPEREFALFALADPQATSTKLNDQQPTVQTERFLEESVPAINSHAASFRIPCYGVALGDIAYFTGSASHPVETDLPVMRDHISKLDLPVFALMGNHDCTLMTEQYPLKTDGTSSTLYLKAQRTFENVMGPANFSFNRGNVHVVCMRNIVYGSSTDFSVYHGGFTDEQISWLTADLASVPMDRRVILCVHIPFWEYYGYGDTKDYNCNATFSLLKKYKDPLILSGHTHYMRNILKGESPYGVEEHTHSAVSGQIWYSNVCTDGAPNGYSVYRFNGTDMTDSYYIGTNNGMNVRDYQLRLYRGNALTGGSYENFRWKAGADVIYANVFNADSRWKVQLYENGTLSGNMTLMPENGTVPAYVEGVVTDIPVASSRDWWAVGYIVGVRGRGHVPNSERNSYMGHTYHMYRYTLKNSAATIKVVATDPYGNRYECSHIMGDCEYPAYMCYGNVPVQTLNLDINGVTSVSPESVTNFNNQ